jgi:hypothetical protein
MLHDAICILCERLFGHLTNDSEILIETTVTNTTPFRLKLPVPINICNINIWRQYPV